MSASRRHRELARRKPSRDATSMSARMASSRCLRRMPFILSPWGGPYSATQPNLLTRQTNRLSVRVLEQGCADPVATNTRALDPQSGAENYSWRVFHAVVKDRHHRRASQLGARRASRSASHSLAAESWRLLGAKPLSNGAKKGPQT